MHIVLLVLIIPFALFLSGLTVAALLLVFTAVVEFPATLAALIAMGWFGYYNLGRFARRQEIPCEQI